ncbi:response regulator [Undibacterium sp. RuRC25W]|uniref:response regulator n=1 Tax=Undibacterium sp. RuRC25W TaxID=3413047 RepID=UPI003BEF831E
MNLFIVEDSVLIQNRLIRFVEEVPGIHVIGVSGDIESAFERVLNSETDAIILDLQLGTGNGLQLLKSIKQRKPLVKIVVLTNHSTDDNRQHAMRAGADGFLDKSTDFERIPDFLHRWQIPNFSNHIN